MLVEWGNMNINAIRVHVPNDTLGSMDDTQCNAYLSALSAAVSANWPDADVEVTDEPATRSVAVAVTDDSDYYAALDAVQNFVGDFWDRYC